jgi:hypothetical protein
VAVAAAAAAAVEAAAAAVSDASIEKKPPHPVPGEKDDKGEMLAKSLGKKICFNRGSDNHWVFNCTNLTATQQKELAGMVHVSIGNKEFKGNGFLQKLIFKPLHYCNF